METKLSKKELLEQLRVIEEKEQNIKDEIFYNNYKDMNFLQMWKNCINWKMVIILSLIVDGLLLLTTNDTSFYIFGLFPMLMILLTISVTFENSTRLDTIKRKKEK